jgi:hypothetical protein
MASLTSGAPVTCASCAEMRMCNAHWRHVSMHYDPGCSRMQAGSLTFPAQCTEREPCAANLERAHKHDCVWERAGIEQGA